ncbi:MAG: ATP-binding protein [Bryobacteraceae bacterium]|nr:ATP-binding protein [Bryobacteraceae bacterium]MDW8378613.1 ATP-binding protein [Bryobacterales bacterium]
MNFTKAGFVSVRAQLVSKHEDKIRILLSVRDTGPGIPEEKRGLIFEPLEQSDRSTTREFGGTGLGLSSCVRLAELMNGKVWLERTLGEGSTFSVELEFAESGPEVAGPPPHSPLPTVESQPAKRLLRVLVAEDNPVHQRLVMRLLEKRGHTPVRASYGTQASSLLLPSGLMSCSWTYKCREWTA